MTKATTPTRVTSCIINGKNKNGQNSRLTVEKMDDLFQPISIMMRLMEEGISVCDFMTKKLELKFEGRVDGEQVKSVTSLFAEVSANLDAEVIEINFYTIVDNKRVELLAINHLTILACTLAYVTGEKCSWSTINGDTVTVDATLSIDEMCGRIEAIDRDQMAKLSMELRDSILEAVFEGADPNVAINAIDAVIDDLTKVINEQSVAATVKPTTLH